MSEPSMSTNQLRRKGLALAISQCLAMGLTGIAQAADIFVADGIVEVAEDGQCSIIEAVLNANGDDQSGSIDCPAGNGRDDILLPFDSVFTFETPDAGSGRALPLLNSDMTFQGNGSTLTRDPSAPEFGLARIEGYVAFRTLTLSNGTVTDGDGGCLIADNGTLDLRNSIVTGCSASGDGGGIHANSGRLRIYNSSTIVSNTASGAGGGVYANDVDGRASGGVIESNSATTGGGIFVGSGTFAVYSEVSGNSASLQGGGIYGNTATLRVRNRVYNNTAADGGGGVFARGGSVDFSNATLVGNSTTTDGGAIRLEDVSATLRSTRVIGNLANAGAGIFVATSTLSSTTSSFRNNDSANEGAAMRALDSNINLQRSIFSGNTAGTTGGAVSMQDGTFVLINSTVENNLANEGGGGIELDTNRDNFAATISQSIFSGNVTTANGGAILLAGEVSATLDNSTFVQNAAGAYGGAIHAFENTAPPPQAGGAPPGGASLAATHLTFSGNSAASGGENLWVDAANAPVALRNSILASGLDEATSDCEVGPGALNENVNNISEDGSCDSNATGLIVDDPLLEALANNGGTPTFGLLAGSPAIDAADETACAAEDQRGVARVPANCDIGAFELTTPILVDVVAPAVGAVAISANDGLCSLPEAILNSSNNNQFSAIDGECETGVAEAADRLILPDSAVFTLTTPDLSNSRNGLPRIESRTTIQGNGSTIQRDAEMPFRFLDVNGNAELTINRLNMMGGLSPTYNRGGAISSSGSLTLNEVTLSGNSTSGAGGAISFSGYNFGVQLSVLNSTLSGNSASVGGGVSGSGYITVINSTISGNTAAGDGGYGRFLEDNLTDEVIASGGGYSYAGAAGGAISVSGYRGELTIVSSTLAFNTADTGAALYIGGTLNLVNSIVADGLGGAADCVLRESQSKGFYSYSGPTGIIGRNISNLIEDGSCDATFSGSGAALLDPLADNGGFTQTHALVTTENLAIDGGDQDSCTEFAFDQRNSPFARSLDGDDNGSVICDIGAFEYDGLTPSDIIFGTGFE